MITFDPTIEEPFNKFYSFVLSSIHDRENRLVSVAQTSGYKEIPESFYFEVAGYHIWRSSISIPHAPRTCV